MESFNTEVGRFYKTPLGDYPSVTTVLSCYGDDTWLKEWRGRVGEYEADRIVKESTDIGTHLHLLFEYGLDGKPLPESNTKEEKTAKRMFDINFPRIQKRMGKIVGQEVPLYSDKIRMAGRCDLIAEFDGELCLLDFKNTKRDKSREDVGSYRLQLKFYDIMIRERLELDIKKHVILMVTREGFLKVFKFDPKETSIREVKDIRMEFYKIHGV